MTRLGHGLRDAALVAVAAAMLLWPALVNGRPSVFTDTALYYAEAEYLGEALGLVQPGRGGLPPGDPTRLPDRPGLASLSADIDGARSPVWGAMLYGLQRVGGIGLAAAVQAALAAAAIFLIHRAVLPAASRRAYLFVMAILAAASSLPVFVTLMMPDVFAGLALIGGVGVLALWDRLQPWRRGALLALIAFSAASHGSIPPLAVAMAVLGAAVLAVSGLPPRRALERAGAVVLAVGIGIVGLRLAYAPIDRRAGETLGTPPFLSARLLADGPGRGRLSQACRDRQAFELCRFARAPMTDSDVILWSHRADRGAFSIAPAAGRRRMEREDLRFAVATVAGAPVAELLAAVRDTALQLVMSGVDDSLRDQGDFVRDGFWRRTALARIIPAAETCRRAGACASRLSPLGFSAWEIAVSTLATGWLIWRLAQRDLRAAWRGRGPPSLDPDRLALVRVATLALLGLVLNAAVCGTLSGPFSRYQARVAWIAPLAAALLFAGTGLAADRRRRIASVVNAVEGQNTRA